jgi:hypothetical protein
MIQATASPDEEVSIVLAFLEASPNNDSIQTLAISCAASTWTPFFFPLIQQMDWLYPGEPDTISKSRASRDPMNRLPKNGLEFVVSTPSQNHQRPNQIEQNRSQKPSQGGFVPGKLYSGLHTSRFQERKEDSSWEMSS